MAVAHSNVMIAEVPILYLQAHSDHGLNRRHSGGGRGKSASHQSLPSKGLVHPSMWEDPWADLRRQASAQKQKRPPAVREQVDQVALPGAGQEGLADALEGGARKVHPWTNAICSRAYTP